MKDFVIQGDFIQTETLGQLSCWENAYLVCVQGKSKGVFQHLPQAYAQLPLQAYPGKLILCGLVDLHLHAPQYAVRGMGMDLELLDWLNTYTFPQEGKYAQDDYAQKAYDIFVRDLKNSPTTRFSAFATIHPEASYQLMKKLETAGLAGRVGLVSMNRNAPEFLCQTHALDTVTQWLAQCQDLSQVKPILTPRFIPSCSDQLMTDLGQLQAETNLPLQSHLSENLGEIAWVKELVPHSQSYGHAYDQFQCFGSHGNTIMAHCIHSSPAEVALMKERGIYVAHCPQSNSDLASGIAPIRHYLNQGLAVGLGSDVAGGHSLSIFQQMAEAVQVSKLRWRLQDNSQAPLTVAEAYYLATKGGGSFFGKVGSLEEGFDFDIIILNEVQSVQDFSLENRLERAVYLGAEVVGKYVQGRKIELEKRN